MKSPYAPLLTLRRAEEREAEAALALANRAVQEREAEVDAARAGRRAWVEACVGDRSGTARGAPALIARLESVEGAALDRHARALTQAERARLTLLERRSQREAVERLHQSVLARAAQEAARRSQAELDDLSGIGARALREGDGKTF